MQVFENSFGGGWIWKLQSQFERKHKDRESKTVAVQDGLLIHDQARSGKLFFPNQYGKFY